MRAKDSTILKLKHICSVTGDSQGETIEKAINILDDLLIIKESKESTNEINLAIQLIMNRV